MRIVLSEIHTPYIHIYIHTYIHMYIHTHILSTHERIKTKSHFI